MLLLNMIVTNKQIVECIIPKLKQRDDTKYNLILANTYTKEIYIFDVVDESDNDLRYSFVIDLDTLNFATYNYYLVEWNDWSSYQLDRNIIDPNYRYYTDKEVISNCGSFLIYKDTMLVTNKMSFKCLGYGTCNSGCSCNCDYPDDPQEEENIICKSLCLYQKGLLQYKSDDCKDKLIEYNNEKNIIQYGK